MEEEVKNEGLVCDLKELLFYQSTNKYSQTHNSQTLKQCINNQQSTVHRQPESSIQTSRQSNIVKRSTQCT